MFLKQRFVNYKKGCTRLAVVRDKVYQLLAQGRWFSPGTPASSTTKTGHHDVAAKTSKTFFGPVKIFRFYLELYKNKFKNLIRTSTFKFSF
jgi:hypothetical protein